MQKTRDNTKAGDKNKAFLRFLSIHVFSFFVKRERERGKGKGRNKQKTSKPL